MKLKNLVVAALIGLLVFAAIESAQTCFYLVALHDATSANEPRVAAAAFQKIFPSASTSRLNSLERHSDLGVAFRAAWQRVRLSLDSEKRQRARAVDAAALDGFIATVTRRLQFTPPEWWTQTLLSAQAYSRENIFFVLPDQSGTALEQPHFTDGTRSFAIFNDDLCIPFKMECVDQTDKKLLWRCEVWADGGLTMYNGSGFWHQVEVIVRSDSVFVFGAGNHCTYIECCDLATGVSKFRFSTAY